MRRAFAILLLLLATFVGRSQTLPPRPADGLTGTAFAAQIRDLPLEEREREIERAVLSGNIPDSLRHFIPVSLTNSNHVVTLRVAPDYLAVGSDADALRLPLTPLTAQQVADRLDCSLPTPKIVDAIYAAATVKLAPIPIPPSQAMTTVPVFAEHHRLIADQMADEGKTLPSGSIVAGHKKDIVVTARLATTAGKVAIYGWHRTNGVLIQPLYLGHSDRYADYSHGVRLVANAVTVDGTNTTLARLLADPALASLLSHEGVVETPRYTVPTPTPPRIEFVATTNFGERIADFMLEPEVKVRLNVPPPESFHADRPVLLVLYALPNGNTIPWTLGKRLAPGDDWRFGIQHVAAQTRFLRDRLTNHTVVLACLESGPKSWPAWRRQHGDAAIPRIIEAIRAPFATNRVEIVLTGHSGGGSFTFGYLNTQERLPAEVIRIAFLDSNYGYDATKGHRVKLAEWLRASDRNRLVVLAYDDANALLDGKPFVSASGGTWGRSAAMLEDFSGSFGFTSATNAAGLRAHRALDGRIAFFLKENPERKIFHTVQVEKNGLIHALLVGTPEENAGYEYFGPRAYERWISAE